METIIEIILILSEAAALLVASTHPNQFKHKRIVYSCFFDLDY
ncbi:hypothetical protein [Vibrio hibernica]|nr:hypothetical protein [Vibrio hibernica]